MKYLILSTFLVTAFLYGLDPLSLKGVMTILSLAFISAGLSKILNRGGLLGWVNIYRKADGRIIISQMPKQSKDEAMLTGRLQGAESKYIGTFKVYR